MRRWILALLVPLLAACGGEGAPSPTAAPTLVAVTATASPVVPTPEAEPASPPVVSPAPSPSPSRGTPSRAGTLPLQDGETTLGPPVSACVGEGLSVVGDRVYTLGRRDGQPCASLIDLASGAIESTDPAAVPAQESGALQVSDPARGRLYAVEGQSVVAYAADGQAIGPVLVLPPGEPEGFTSITALRLDDAAGRLYVGYRDFDGQAWIAVTDLASGEAVVDVAVPAGPWALSADGRLVFADAATLLVRDRETLQLNHRLSLSRRPAAARVDPEGARLFVTDAGGDLHVLDAVSLAERERRPGLGAALDLDPRLGRLYVGDRYSDGVAALDLATLELLGRIPRPGQPVASPADGQVYILEEEISRADGATLGVLEPGAGRRARHSGCTGCRYVTDLIVDPNSGQVFTTTATLGEPGPANQATVDPRTGRAFVARTTGGAQAVYSLALYPDLSLGQPTRWIDGLYGQPLYDPAGERLYLAQGGRLLLLDGQTLAFVGGVGRRDESQADLALLDVDRLSGSLYAARGAQLLRFEPAGLAQPQAAPGPQPVGDLPGPVYGLAISPSFARDGTLFARAVDLATGYAHLYRSRDGGAGWDRLGGGLPGPPNDLVFAPDGRLYAALAALQWRAAPESATWGEGVYVSRDGGDTWRPDDAGLAHLRVGGLHAAQDGTLYALAASAIEPGSGASGPTLWTRAPGQTWTPLRPPEVGPLRLQDFTVPLSYTLDVRAYWHELTGGGPLYQAWGQELRRSDDGGRTWRAVGQGPVAYAQDVFGGSQGAGVYWLGPEVLWRSTDEGETWAAPSHPALAGGPPFLATVTEVDGEETLFLGTEEGRVLVVPVSEAVWEPLSG